ncbi:ATP-binding protein [Candidatus Dojkabacteria bacterium]|nr:ATP-binding protein [Candidatus Dojkabacteria bacterium]
MQLAQAQANEQIGIRDILAPSYIEVDFNYIQVGRKYFRTLFISKYPRVVRINWLSPLINFDSSLIISTHYYPLDIKDVLARLKKKMGELEATLMVQVEKGKVIDPTAKVALKDAQSLQDAIASGAEKLFQFGLYVTVEANSTEELNKVTKDVVSTISALDMQADPTTLQMEQGLQSSIPSGVDKLFYNRNLDTTSIATTFPFITSELTMDHGILYGVNLHNKSLVVFDRFDLENANSTVFARSGAGKSYFVKLEIFRSLMLGTEVIIIDPEKEYESLAKSLDGLYITFSQDEGYKVNPFELPGALIEEGVDQLREKILSLQRFFNIMFGGTSNLEKAILDRAMMLTYNEKGITVEPSTQSNPAPLLEDLYKVLKGFTEEDAQSLAKRMERFIIGSAAGIFNERTNLSLDNPFTVFSIRDLSEELRPLAMYQMLDFIWTNIRKIRKKRILVVEEAWYMMQRPDSAEFMYSIAKRARKYYLGLTTISQDVDDFLSTDYGKAVVNNSAMQILLKQSSSAIDRIQFVFKLTEGERSFLLRCGIGEGLFFAGNNHVAIKSVSSLAEHRLMTTNPQEMDFYKQVGLMDDTDSEKLSKVFTPTLVESLYGNKNGNI